MIRYYVMRYGFYVTAAAWVVFCSAKIYHSGADWLILTLAGIGVSAVGLFLTLLGMVVGVALDDPEEDLRYVD